MEALSGSIFGFPAGCLRAGDWDWLRGPGGNTTGAPVDAEAGGEQVSVSLVCLFVLGFLFLYCTQVPV